MKWAIGCSGFSYKDWKEVFYPPKLAQKKWFAFYCEHFNSIELNVSFYRFPTVELLQNWYDKSPDGFTFAVKAPRLITHYRQLTGTEELLKDFYNACEKGLKEKLGAVLFQFPPGFSYTEERLQQIVSSLDNSFSNVIEFRHEGWWNEKVYQTLQQHNIIFCGISHPSLPDGVVINGPIVYYRFHGVPKLYYSEYNSKIIRSFANQLISNSGVKRSFCFFNNTATMAAITNARMLQQYTSR